MRRKFLRHVWLKFNILEIIYQRKNVTLLISKHWCACMYVYACARASVCMYVRAQIQKTLAQTTYLHLHTYFYLISFNIMYLIHNICTQYIILCIWYVYLVHIMYVSIYILILVILNSVDNKISLIFFYLWLFFIFYDGNAWLFFQLTKLLIFSQF